MKIAKIVGCGLSGITAAVLLKKKGYKPIIFEKRNHIGGNCFDENINGINVHKYGPHIFHTNDKEVFLFLSKFTGWYPFKNRPKAVTDCGVFSLPYSKKTISEIGRQLTSDEYKNLFLKGYSEKQWGQPFKKIPHTILNRVPVTENYNDPTWYEGEKYQCLPYPSYTKMMENMLDGIEVKLNCTDKDWKTYKANLTIFTGRIDEYYKFCFGELPYRSLDFKTKISENKLFNPVINYCVKNVPYTRKVDYSYFTYNNKETKTIIVTEYPKKCETNDIPYYPVSFGDGLAIYHKYKKLADKEKNTIFLGRLATFTYLDMWMAVKQVMLKLTSW